MMDEEELEMDPRIVELQRQLAAMESIVEDPAVHGEFDGINKESIAILRDQLAQEKNEVSMDQLSYATRGIEIKAEELRSLVSGNLPSAPTQTSQYDDDDTTEPPERSALSTRESRGSTRQRVEEDKPSAIIAARNRLNDYCDELRTVATRFPTEVPAFSVLEFVDNVEQWCKENPDAPCAAIHDVHKQLEEQMVVCGASLKVELRAFEAREKYSQELMKLAKYEHSTRWKTGEEQPWIEPERRIIQDLIFFHKKWIESQESVLAPRQNFHVRAEILSKVTGGSPAERKRELHLHVAYRASELRTFPPEDVSLEQNRQVCREAGAILEALDAKHWSEFDYVELWDILERVQYAKQRAYNAADLKAYRNELENLLDHIDKCAQRDTRIMNSLEEEARYRLVDMCERVRLWLTENPNASLRTLHTLLREVRLRSAEEGLAVVESISRIKERAAQEAKVIQSLSPARADNRENAAGERSTEEAGVPVKSADLAVVDVACSLIQESHLLKVDAVNFKRQCIGVEEAAKRDELQQLLEQIEKFKQWATKEILDGSPESVVENENSLTKKFRDLLDTAEALGVRVSPSCYNRLRDASE